MAETEETLKAEVLGVCRNYYSQVWNEAFNQVGVEASSTLRKVENIYYPPTIQESVPSSLRTDTLPEVSEAGKDNIAKVLTSFDTTSKVAKWPEDRKSTRLNSSHSS